MVKETMYKCRILYISPEPKTIGGRDLLSCMFMENLSRLLGNKFKIYRLVSNNINTNFLERLMGRIDGITSGSELELVTKVIRDKPDCIFIEGSNLGRLTKLFKKFNDDIPIYTFYHNIETKFFYDAFWAGPTLHGLGVLIANANAERWSAKYSDRCILLSDRDAQLHAKLYKRSTNDLLPMVVRDEYTYAHSNLRNPYGRPYALFVGGGFFANVEGMAWYAKYVAHASPLETVVIGRGMDQHRSRLERFGGVKVIGEVDDLSPWYANAHTVVAPILSGSGMKTKIAEALMHGKRVIGTPEAFSGYNVEWTDKLQVCCQPQNFISALQHAASDEMRFNPDLRAYYQAHHSEEALINRLGNLLSAIPVKPKKESLSN